MPARRPMRFIGRASRRRTAADPSLEALDVLGRAGLVARHAALADPVDGVGVLAHVVVGGEIKGKRHRLDVVVAEEAADVLRERRYVLWHAQKVTVAPQRTPTASTEAAAAVAVSRAYVVRARSRTMPAATRVPSRTRNVIWSPRPEPGEITGCVPIGACLGAMPAIRSASPPKTRGAIACASDRSTVRVLSALPHRPEGMMSRRAASSGGLAADSSAAPPMSNQIAEPRSPEKMPTTSSTAAPM